MLPKNICKKDDEAKSLLTDVLGRKAITVNVISTLVYTNITNRRKGNYIKTIKVYRLKLLKK